MAIILYSQSYFDMFRGVVFLVTVYLSNFFLYFVYFSAGTIHTATRHDPAACHTRRLQVGADHHSVLIVVYNSAALARGRHYLARWRHSQCPGHDDIFHNSGSTFQLTTRRSIIPGLLEITWDCVYVV